MESLLTPINDKSPARSFRAEIVALIAKGVTTKDLLQAGDSGNYKDMCECCEFLVNRGLWLEIFCNGQNWKWFKLLVIVQHPQLAALDGLEMTLSQLQDFVITRFGPRLTLRQVENPWHVTHG